MVKEKRGSRLGSGFNKPILSWLSDHPGDYLEIGCYWGVFFSEVAEYNPQHTAYAIDPHIADGHTGEKRGSNLSHIKEDFLHNISGLDNVVFWDTTTKKCLELKKYNDIKNLSCVLIDGSHHYRDIVVDVDFVANIKHTQEVMVVFDDLHILDVAKSIDYFIKTIGERVSNRIDGHNHCSFILKPSV